METTEEQEHTAERCLACGKDLAKCDHRQPPICGPARHLAIKASDVRWRTETSAESQLENYELRNCVACGATLARPL